MAQRNDDGEQSCSIKLKQSRDRIDWDRKDEREAFLRIQLYPLVENWQGGLPDLRDIFQPNEIDWLVGKDSSFTGHGSIKCPLVDFVIGTGYKDVARAWPDWVPLIHRIRNTPVHYLAGQHRDHLESCEGCRSKDTADDSNSNVDHVMSRLFEIYDGPNHEDTTGLTHFHVACEYGLYDVVESFLERLDPFWLLDQAWPLTGDDALHLALLRDRRRVAELLLRRGNANPTYANKKGMTPLHIVCRRNYDADFVRMLFEIDEEKNWQMKVDARDKEGNTPLHHAVRHSSERTVELLLSRGADPSAANRKGQTPLHLVIERSSWCALLVKSLLDRRDKLLIDARNELGETPLHLALRHDNLEAAVWLLRSNGANPLVADEKGETPLHIVCRRHRDSRTLEQFFGQRSDKLRPSLVWARLDDEGNTPLHLALGQRNIEFAKLLLDRDGADPSVANWKGTTPLHIVCQKKYPIDTTERLLFDHPSNEQPPMKVDALDGKGKTPLHYALVEDDAAMAELLLSRGADPSLALHVVCEKKFTRHLAETLFKHLNKLKARKLERRIDARNKEGRTPLHLALRNGNLEAAVWLLRRGADLIKAEKDGLIPLHVVCKLASPADKDLAKLFFQRARRGLRVDALDKEGNTALHLALNKGNKRLAKRLLKRGADPNLAGAEGETPLHVVGARNDDAGVELAETLIKYGGDRLRVDAIGQLGRTPLHLALRQGNKRLVELLLKAGADLDRPDAEGETGLHIACQKYDDDHDIPKMILTKSKSCSGLDARNKWGDTPLHLALRNGRRRATEWLLRRGADPNAPNELGQTPLHAMSQPRPRDDRLVKMLFKLTRGQQLRIDTRDEDGSTPLHLAVCGGHAKALGMLLSRGADPNAVDARGATPLHRVCEDRHELAEPFLGCCERLGVTVRMNERDNEGNSPLHLALRMAGRPTVELLLRRGADPNLANAKGETPLLTMIRENREVDLVETLLEFSDDKYRPVRVNERDREGNSPLHWALLRRDRDDSESWRKLVELLLREGADPNLANEEGRTPLHLVCERRRQDLLKIVFDRYDGRVRVNARDKKGNTALHVAASAADSSRGLIEFLLAKGADPSIANEEGSTPLHIVCRGCRDVDSARLLFEHCDKKKQLVETRDDEGNAPLHLALQFGGRDSKRLVMLLLARGADPNEADREEAATPLHLVCKRYRDAELVDAFFKMCDELHKRLRLDARNWMGNSPLHVALEWANDRAAETLLTRGADPNQVNDVGETPLHVMSKDRYYEDSMKMFFRICDEKRRDVRVNGRDMSGNAPLHLALSCGAESSVEALLRRGADPNTTNARGLTAVQICLENDDDDEKLLKLLFEICDDINQTNNKIY
uniref:Uncharacterized protein n=1 Tax=Trichogramma kaykai TaxID=54128 RepID=A0ABD2X5S7_9HYME